MRKPCQEQKISDLPQDRLEPAPPFTFTGVDFFGPFIIKEGRKELKRYGVIFTCLVSRSIHLEAANSLETDSFTHCLQRFIARRGTVQEIRCDNGTNFIGTRNELNKACHPGTFLPNDRHTGVQIRLKLVTQDTGQITESPNNNVTYLKSPNIQDQFT
ncbi:uncharacterized protein [Palaemon carinicauda]|uniref:uncharacterized protein n=1 Tax=Palaemon carinicauda TaxID=392227 RepID=UPI0035B597E4